MTKDRNKITNIELFVELFPIKSSKELEIIFNVSKPTIARQAKKLNLSKDKEYLKRMCSERSKGHGISDAGRTKISQLAKERKMSDDTKAKVLATKKERGTLLKGEKHHNWKGGKPWERFENEDYQRWRTAVLNRDKYTCQHCYRICKKREKGLAAHHIKAYATHPDLRLELSNGLTLCRQCHMKVHGKKIKPKELVACACGCGTMIEAIDPYGQPRKYVNGHCAKGRKLSQETIEKIKMAKKGKQAKPEDVARRAASFRKKDPSVYKYPTMKEQGRNKSSNRIIELDGEKRCLAEWSEIAGIHSTTIASRLKNGWNMRDAISIPPSKKNSNRRGKGKANYKKS